MPTLHKSFRESSSYQPTADVSVLARWLGHLLWLYQCTISPFLAPACRYAPRCSDYGRDAVARYGACKGGWMTVRRLLRCHPGSPGGWDPVP